MKTYDIVRVFDKRTKIKCKCGNIYNVKHKNTIENPCECNYNTKSEENDDVYTFSKNKTLKEGLEFGLSIAHFKQLINSDCYYCKASPRIPHKISKP